MSAAAVRVHAKQKLAFVRFGVAPKISARTGGGVWKVGLSVTRGGSGKCDEMWFNLGVRGANCSAGENFENYESETSMRNLFRVLSADVVLKFFACGEHSRVFLALKFFSPAASIPQTFVYFYIYRKEFFRNFRKMLLKDHFWNAIFSKTSLTTTTTCQLMDTVTKWFNHASCRFRSLKSSFWVQSKRQHFLDFFQKIIKKGHFLAPKSSFLKQFIDDNYDFASGA